MAKKDYLNREGTNTVELILTNIGTVKLYVTLEDDVAFIDMKEFPRFIDRNSFDSFCSVLTACKKKLSDIFQGKGVSRFVWRDIAAVKELDASIANRVTIKPHKR